jgi:hypothetical protein
MQPDLIGDEVRALPGLWRAAIESGETRRFFLAAHDLSGLGTTFGQPLVTALCRSLCRVLRGYEALRGEPARLVEAHLDALETGIACGITEAAEGPGKLLLDELDAAFARLEG